MNTITTMTPEKREREEEQPSSSYCPLVEVGELIYVDTKALLFVDGLLALEEEEEEEEKKWPRRKYTLCAFLGFEEDVVHKPNSTYFQIYMRLLCKGQIIKAYLIYNYPVATQESCLSKTLEEIRDKELERMFTLDMISRIDRREEEEE